MGLIVQPFRYQERPIVYLFTRLRPEYTLHVAPDASYGFEVTITAADSDDVLWAVYLPFARDSYELRIDSHFLRR